MLGKIQRTAIVMLALFASEMAARTSEFVPPSNGMCLAAPPVIRTLPLVAPRGPVDEARAGGQDDAHSGQDLLIHAAGAVKVAVPPGWTTSETAKGIEVRITMSPRPVVGHRRMPTDGVWFSYHVRPETSEDASAELGRMMNRRLRLATDNMAATEPPQSLRLGRWPALKQEFLVRAVGQDGPPPTEPRRGFHLLARTAWGVFELHALSPERLYRQRSVEFERLVEQITLDAPRVAPHRPFIEVRDAGSILGSWKALRSRFRLKDDGRIEIQFDRRGSYTFGRQVAGSTSRRSERLTGRYRAQDDILRIRWDDGSLLNYRWRLSDGELLLTDHTGQVSRLRRLLE